MKVTAWMLLTVFVFAACSGSKSAQDVSQQTPQVELTDADEFAEPSIEEAAAPVAEAAVPEDSLDEEVSTPELKDDSGTIAVASTTGDLSEKTYAVQKNETLMMIAFKIYGDYDKWRQLANRNQTALHGGTTVLPGTVLKYIPPVQEFVWNPEGNPYLIKLGDTLGKISGSVYGTPKKWKSIWDNNRPLIKNPNRIFAGFTIYYLGQEKVATTF